jgi:hypothetical protein
LKRCNRDNKEGVESFMQKRPAKFTGTLNNTNVQTLPWWAPIDVFGRVKGEPVGKPKI